MSIVISNKLLLTYLLSCLRRQEHDAVAVVLRYNTWIDSSVTLL